MIAVFVFCVYALIAFVVAGQITEDDDDSTALGLLAAVTWPISLPLIVLVARWIRERDAKTGNALRERIGREMLACSRLADNDEMGTDENCDPPEEAT